MTRQLTFDLGLQERQSRDDFFVSPANAAALAMVDAWRLWPGGMMLLVGPMGAGKTHLARIWADATEGRILSAEMLATGILATGMLSEADLPALAALPALVLEDADRIAGVPAAETALFHLFNMRREAGLPLLMTARLPPRDWGLTLPDLASRMGSLALTRLDPPDDTLLAAVLAKLFSDRQVAAPPSLIPWLVARMERSIDAARRIVAELDARALARGGPISRTDAADLVADPLDRPDLE